MTEITEALLGCERCGGELPPKPMRGHQARFCSTRCRRQQTRACLTCGKTFASIAHKQVLFCSRACWPNPPHRKWEGLPVPPSHANKAQLLAGYRRVCAELAALRAARAEAAAARAALARYGRHGQACPARPRTTGGYGRVPAAEFGPCDCGLQGAQEPPP